MIPAVTLQIRSYGPLSRPWLGDGEQDIILTLLDSVSPRRMIEFGVNEGMTAQAVLKYIRTIEHYTGVDVPTTYRTELPEQQHEIPEWPGCLVQHDPRFELIVRDRTFFDTMITSAEPYDAAFIDGDHGRNAVRTDYELAKRIVRPDGIIIFHDYGNTFGQVTEAVNEFVQQGSNIFSVEGSMIAYELR